MEPYKVYVKTDAAGHIVAVNSSEFLPDPTGWVEIDEGTGDRYHHAQGNYFPLPIVTDGGAYRYKLQGGAAVECTAEEIAEQEAANRPGENPAPGGTAEAQLAEMAAAIERGLTT